MKTLLWVFAAVIFVSGCGGGDGSYSPEVSVADQKATDVWEGTTCDLEGRECVTTCLVTPGAELYCMNADGQVLFGYAAVSGNVLTANFDWADRVGIEGQDATTGEGQLRCDLSPHEMLSCELTAENGHGGFSEGAMTLFHKELDPATHSCYFHDFVLQAQVGGSWAPWGDAGPTLAIDRAGRAFSQSPEAGCVLNGTVIKTYGDVAGADREDPYNLFSVRLYVEGCTDPAYAVYNGRVLRGFAFLDQTRLENDTLVMMTVVRVPEGYAAFGARYRRQ